MPSYIVHKFNSGEIVKITTCDQEAAGLQVDGGESYIPLLSTTLTPEDIFLNYYAPSGVLTQRPGQNTSLNKTSLTADGIDEIIISNAPSGATLTAVNEDTGDIVSAVITSTDSFSTAVAGTIKLTIELFPYLPFKETIYAS